MESISIISFTIAAVLMINVVLASFVVFFERRNPASTWAWLLVLFFIPVFGFMIYFIFGRDSKREKVFDQKATYDYDVYFQYLFSTEKYKKTINAQKWSLKQRDELITPTYLADMANLHVNSGNWITSNNELQIFNDGKSKFRALFHDIENAKEYIHMEYYIIRGDELGKRLVKALAVKARQGVQVRLLYDGMGCSKLPKDFFDELVDAGGHAASFLPPFFVRLNYRDHRKIVVIDGEVAYIGGFNIGNEYLGIVKRYGNWRDTHLRLTGDAIDQIQLRFIMDWNFTSKHQIPLEKNFFPDRKARDGIKMQIVSSGPDTRWNNIRNGYFKMINEAEDHVYIATPYFVPDDGIFAALKVAALAGIDVRIIIPGNPDHIFVYWASMSYLGELLECGVLCSQYEKGFIHSKVISIDGEMVSIGTANMDVRSFDVNFEANAFIYDKDVAVSVEDDFINDLSDCCEILPEWYANRSAVFKIRESVARLVSPML